MRNAEHHNLAVLIDHTLLKPEASEADYVKLCGEANEHGFFAVCLPPFFVPLARTELQNTPVKICTVVGFPLGYDTTATKVHATQIAIQEGADEIDMVLNIAAIKSNQLKIAEADIQRVVVAAEKKIVKVILECSLLTPEEISLACRIAENAGAQFVKTSTGFAAHGARTQDVKLMRGSVSSHIQVKASGGIRDLKTALDMIEAGATRLGTSASVAIVKGAKA